jgi:hypothetical protein
VAEAIQYTPPPTVKRFIMDYRPAELFYDWIVGPVGSGKTTGLFFKLIYMAKKQARSPDGVRRSRAVVVRSTMPQLKDTTIKSWDAWFRGAGKWALTERNFTLRFDDVECEVLFRALDTPDDVTRVLSLEITFAIIDEFIAIPRAIIDALSGRLGRYPAAKDGGATNWGMWGSSNPGTEDNWWYDYLHDDEIVQLIRLFGTPERVAKVRAILDEMDTSGRNVRYFIQPPGNGDDAENLPNLPGGANYYAQQSVGKSPAWIKQFIEAEWGYSASETPVIKTFSPVAHVARTSLKFNPDMPLIAGFDPGIGGTAMVFGQEDMHGRLLILSELGAIGYGITRFITEKVKPHLRAFYPNATLIIAPDPASANRTQTDERSVVEILKKHFPVKIETNNQLAKRLDAIESYTTRNTEMGPALLIDRDMAPTVVRALAGGWRFGMVPKGDTQKPAPDKNSFSHYGDATGYLARYFHRQFEKGGQRGVTLETQRAIARRPTAVVPRYHFS